MRRIKLQPKLHNVVVIFIVVKCVCLCACWLNSQKEIFEHVCMVIAAWNEYVYVCACINVSCIVYWLHIYYIHIYRVHMLCNATQVLSSSDIFGFCFAFNFTSSHCAWIQWCVRIGYTFIVTKNMYARRHFFGMCVVLLLKHLHTW